MADIGGCLKKMFVNVDMKAIFHGLFKKNIVYVSKYSVVTCL